MNNRRTYLAEIAEKMARKPFHGNTIGLKSNLAPITDLFPPWSAKKWNGKWCAAFVYYCCIKAGFDLPVRYPKPVTCNFAGVVAWLQWSKLPQQNFYYSRSHQNFRPDKGDIVIYDNVFIPSPHDHIGILLNCDCDRIIVAEGNVNNISNVLERRINKKIRGFIRISNDI